jgi:hypothetical protein
MTCKLLGLSKEGVKLVIDMTSGSLDLKDDLDDKI